MHFIPKGICSLVKSKIPWKPHKRNKPTDINWEKDHPDRVSEFSTAKGLRVEFSQHFFTARDVNDPFLESFSHSAPYHLVSAAQPWVFLTKKRGSQGG